MTGDAEAGGAQGGATFRAPSLELPNTRTTRSDDDHVSLSVAGWSTSTRMELAGGFESLRWSNLRTLWAARDEKLAARMLTDPARAMRNAWIGAAGPEAAFEVPLEVRLRGAEPRRVLLVGDTGDRSEAQAAVARQLLGRASHPGAGMQSEGVDAVLIQSDLVYPAGHADRARGGHRAGCARRHRGSLALATGR
jgi:hypothetical protein